VKNTPIEWAHHTVNFWWGCTFAKLLDGSVREECKNCYALLLSKLFSRGKATWGSDGRRWVRHEAARRELYKLDKSAWKRGVRERVFINSMSDTFEDRRDLDEAREMLWGACSFVSNIDMLLLTKRPENVTRMVPPSWLKNWPAHVWIGTTAGTQAAADQAIPELLAIPSAVRFLSMEPLLGPVDLASMKIAGTVNWSLLGADGIDWVIVGGESGPRARPMHPAWATTLRDQCKVAGVPFFFKQWGEWMPARQVGDMLGVQELSRRKRIMVETDTSLPAVCVRVGTNISGRLLDGVVHNEFPS
jgi:protein gp37